MTRARARWFVESIITAGNTIWHLAIKPPLWNTCCRRNCSIVAAKPVHAFCPCRRTSASRSDFFFTLRALSRFLHLFFSLFIWHFHSSSFPQNSCGRLCSFQVIFLSSVCARVKFAAMGLFPKWARAICSPRHFLCCRSQGSLFFARSFCAIN